MQKASYVIASLLAANATALYTSPAELFGDALEARSNGGVKCFACSAAMTGVQHLLEFNLVHNGLLKAATLACEISGAMGDRFKTCPDLIRQFGEPLFDVAEQYLFTRERICNENLGYCNWPIITKINVEDVVENILAPANQYVSA